MTKEMTSLFVVFVVASSHADAEADADADADAATILLLTIANTHSNSISGWSLIKPKKKKQSTSFHSPFFFPQNVQISENSSISS